MIKNSLETNNLISSKNAILIYNILRALGLNTTLKGTKLLNKAIQIVKGTKLLNKAIQIVINSNDEFIVIEDVYNQLTLNYKKFNPVQIRNTIKYAIDNRDEQKSKNNFEQIFGYKYDDYYFTNKTLIEEIARVVKYNC